MTEASEEGRRDPDGRLSPVPEDVPFEANYQLVFAPPKYGTGRDVPLSDALAFVLSEHLRKFPPVVVELPWGDPGAAKVRRVRVPLVFTSREHKALNRNYINQFIWKPALTEAGVAPVRSNGMHALRHFCASNWLEQGVSIRASPSTSATATKASLFVPTRI